MWSSGNRDSGPSVLIEVARCAQVFRARCARLWSRRELKTFPGCLGEQSISALMNFANVRRLEAFEPNPEAFATLAKRFDQRPHTQLHNFALGEETTTATLNVIENSGLSSLLKPGKIIQQEYAPASRV